MPNNDDDDVVVVVVCSLVLISSYHCLAFLWQQKQSFTLNSKVKIPVKQCRRICFLSY